MTRKNAQTTNKFIFATGIECSYPTIVDQNGKTVRHDQLGKSFHYSFWEKDLELVRELGIQFLRYGPPYYKTHLGSGKYDFDFTDQVFSKMQQLDIIPILDLCHFGVPDFIGDFQNADFPKLFAQYAGDFAMRYPWIKYYTPVNEIYVCAKLSALEGKWNEKKKSDKAFVTAIKNLCTANLLAIQEILKVRPDAVFIQSESAEYFHSGSTSTECDSLARFENERRFLSFDLLYSHSPSTLIGQYLFDNGLTKKEYDFFMNHNLGNYIIMGNDFYERNEQIVTGKGGIKPAGDVFGWQVITKQYFDRYKRPVMHTETNIQDETEAPRWLWKEFFNVMNLREQGIPVIGFTWYSLVDQVDWDSALSLDRSVVNPLGLFDLQRKPRPVAKAFQTMLKEFRDQPLLPGSYLFSFFTN